MILKTLAPLSLLCLVMACGPTTQAAARDAATSRSCDWYEKCEEIGPAEGADYANRDECEIEVRNHWNNQWPSGDCDGKINDAELDICLKAIEITECANGFDFLNTVFNKCSKDKVCSGS